VTEQTDLRKMDEEDLKQLFRNGSSRSDRRGWRCPDDMRLAAYVDGGVKAKARESLESHLADCDACLSEVSFLMHSAVLVNAEQVPPQLLARARALVSEKRRDSTLPGWRWALAAAAACVLITFATVLTLRLYRAESQPADGRLAARQEPTQTPAAPSLATPPAKNPNAVALSSSPSQSVRAGLPNPQAATPQIRNVDSDTHAPKLLLPHEGAVVKRENLEFRWQSVADSTFYEVSIVTASGDQVMVRQTEETRLELSSEAKLISGEKYFVSVRAHLREGKTVRSSVVSFRISD
jgi:hypothetical protein